jgi:hypothetical protein
LEKDTNIERPRTYEIDNLAADLENALTSSTIVKSKKFIQTLQKMVARLMLPGLEENQWAEIDEEIEASDTLSLIDPNSGLSEEELEAGGGPVTRRTLRRRVTEED